MEEEPDISIMELTPIETISNDNSAVLYNDGIRFSNSENVRSPRAISEGIKDYIEDKPKTTIKSNQVGIDIPANDYTAKDLNKKQWFTFEFNGISYEA